MNRSSMSPYKGGRTVGREPESLQLLVRSLERQNTSLVDEINRLKTQERKLLGLEQRVDMVLKHNNQLLSQNEKLAKLINQKKSEIETWKNKYDALSLNRANSNEMETRKLLNEIEKLKEEITDIEHVKNMQISELKNQQHLELQGVKRNNLNNNQKYQLEIRKLKQYSDRKEYEISQVNMKLVRLTKETDFEISKLREEKDRLRSDLLFEQTEHKKQIDTIKNKFEINFHTEIESLKKQQINQVQALEYESAKLKDVINAKNIEIQQILSKNLKVKGNYETSVELFKRENQDLKEKVLQTQQISTIQLNNLREKLQNIKESEINMLRDSYENQLNLLKRQIQKLQQIIESRNRELEALAKQRNHMRVSLEGQIQKLKTQLDRSIDDIKQLQQRHEEEIRICDHDLKCKNQEMKAMEQYLQTQIKNVQLERDNFKDLLTSTSSELNRERLQNQQTKAKLNSQVNLYREKSMVLRDDLEREVNHSKGNSEDLQKRMEKLQARLEANIQALQLEGKEKDKIINQLKETIQLKNQQIKQSDDKINYLENAQTELRREARDNLNRWTTKENEYNQLIKSQIQNLEKQRKREIEELNGIHNNKSSSYKHEIQQLQRQLGEKNKLLNKLKSQYEMLVGKFQEIFGQRAGQKNLDIKIPGWIPDTLATKSLFDVFLKNKVLDYCS